jgi:uncharacterized protein YxeA
MKKFLFTLLALLMCVSAANAFFDKYTIDRENLPEEARQMIDEFFPKAKISMIKVDRHLLKKTDYDVSLTNGTKIEFSNKGKWTSVNCGKREIPEDLVPKTIRNYISKNFSGIKISGIAKRNAGYDITLSDGNGLRFNLLGQYKGPLTEKDK